jgi:hypothetical protein
MGETEYQAPDHDIDLTSAIDFHSSVVWNVESSSHASLPQAIRDRVAKDGQLANLIKEFAEADQGLKEDTGMYFEEACTVCYHPCVLHFL